MKEIREILGDLDYEILSMKEAGVDVDIVEDGTTFEENAIIKAKTVMEATGSLVLADDSGLEVDYLNKEPGVYSARYMGENTSYRIKNQIILDRLHGVLAIKVRSDHLRIILVQHSSANHDFTVRLMLTQQPDRLFHTGHGGGHKGA